MALTPSFSVSQVLGAASVLTLTDTSTGSDGAISARKIYLNTAAGTTLVPTGTATTYIPWDYAQISKSVDVLNQDYALFIVVEWVDVSDTVLYTASGLYCFTMYSELFLYGLTQNEASVPNIIQDTNYYDNKQKLRVYVDDANNAVAIGGDIAAAQSSLNRAAYMIANQNIYF